MTFFSFSLKTEYPDSVIGQPPGGGGHQDSHPGHPDGHLGHPVQLHHSPVVSSPGDMKLESLHSEPPSYLSYQVHNKFNTVRRLIKAIF